MRLVPALTKWVQADAAGSRHSGGPLADAQGRVIGISAIAGGLALYQQCGGAFPAPRVGGAPLSGVTKEQEARLFLTAEGNA